MITLTCCEKVEKHVFRVYDTNNDGFIDFVEFMIALHVLSEGTPHEVLTKIFRVFDENSDQHISRQEMEHLVGDLHALIPAKDAQKATKKEIAEAAFKEMDSNMDGQVRIMASEVGNLKKPTCPGEPSRVH